MWLLSRNVFNSYHTSILHCRFLKKFTLDFHNQNITTVHALAMIIYNIFSHNPICTVYVCFYHTVMYTVNPLLSPSGGLFISSMFEGGRLKREGGLFNLAKRITGRKKKTKKQTRVTIPYFLFWTRAMTV